MPEEVTEGPEGTEGQAPEGPDGGQTTEGAPEGTEGQPDAGITEGGPQEPTFFDPKSVPDELQPAYKQMQGAFTRKMQELRDGKQKIEAYDAFTADPVGQLQQMAQRYGFHLTRAEAAQQLQQQQEGQQQTGGEWQPNNWDEVFSAAEQRIMQKLNPVLQQVQEVKKASIEHQLSEIDPTWQQYEDDMKRNMAKHPTLANDAALLYKMSVPEEVLQSRATQAALKKLEAKGKSAQVSGKSTTTKHPKEGLPDQPVSFDEAVKAAKKKLADEGITPLGNKE